MRNTQFILEDVFDDVVSKDIFSQKHIIKLKTCLAKIF